MFFYDSLVIEALECIKDPKEAIEYVRDLFEVSEQVYEAKNEYSARIYFPLNNHTSNQKTFKMVEEVIEYSIRTNNLDILPIVDMFVYAFFYDESNLEYLFNSNYIIWCEHTYMNILNHGEYNKWHKQRKIDPRFYTDRDVKWFYRNYNLLRNVPYKDISVKHTDIENYMFKNKAFMKFLCNVDSNIVYKNIINDTNGIEKFHLFLKMF